MRSRLAICQNHNPAHWTQDYGIFILSWCNNNQICKFSTFFHKERREKRIFSNLKIDLELPGELFEEYGVLAFWSVWVRLKIFFHDILVNIFMANMRLPISLRLRSACNCPLRSPASVRRGIACRCATVEENRSRCLESHRWICWAAAQARVWSCRLKNSTAGIDYNQWCWGVGWCWRCQRQILRVRSFPTLGHRSSPWILFKCWNTWMKEGGGIPLRSQGIFI